ncbi:TetR family transcriptional regulator C-terminal domain-containing protein [Marimonas lutisalis]|uniref:TetR family transcriptional regulator C-terminal domain-containing protein n=1 Tax=Marimonas lutisalis TaxID=2545756 RepID=UPI0010F99C94|nr:TetR family transcriptional regulator C-terminal domain-containing protein [Marimonas lutisalis]
MSRTTTQKPRKERKENADRRRRQLLDAARRSILRHGLAKTTLATVADEAGLSQGVAVFYFKSKGGLLTETLRDLYQSYETLWMQALKKAGDDPRRRLEAIIEADFDARACGPEVLPLWFAFWGELHFQSQYDEVAEDFDARRQTMMVALWNQLLGGDDDGEAWQMAEWMDTLTDGYWQRLHLSPGGFDREKAREATKMILALMQSEVKGRNA